MVKVTTRVPKIVLTYTVEIGEDELRGMGALASLHIDTVMTALDEAFPEGTQRLVFVDNESEIRTFLECAKEGLSAALSATQQVHRAVKDVTAIVKGIEG